MAHSHDHDHSHYHHHSQERSTRIVVFISFITMILELYFGKMANSRALWMDGLHMLTHVLVLVISWFAYLYIRMKAQELTHEKKHRVVSLAGFASAIILLVVTLWGLYETVFPHEHEGIKIGEQALLIACIGLVVNGVSAYLLHREEEHTDHNLKAAYLHVLSDVMLSFLAILSIVVGMYTGITWLDVACAVIGSVVILQWSIGLIRKSWREALG